MPLTRSSNESASEARTDMEPEAIMAISLAPSSATFRPNDPCTAARTCQGVLLGCWLAPWSSSTSGSRSPCSVMSATRASMSSFCVL
eukprot:5894491-Prymnesium_polylepis.2